MWAVSQYSLLQRTESAAEVRHQAWFGLQHNIDWTVRTERVLIHVHWNVLHVLVGFQSWRSWRRVGASHPSRPFPHERPRRQVADQDDSLPLVSECRTRARDERFLIGAWRPAKIGQLHNMRKHHNICYHLRLVVLKRARLRFVTCERKRRHVAARRMSTPNTTKSPGTGPCCTFPCCYKPRQHSTCAHQ